VSAACPRCGDEEEVAFAIDATITPLPFAEAIAQYRGRVPLTDEQFRRLSDEARTQAFAMSGVSREDAAAELYGATLRAIEDGTSGGEWQREARGILAAKGITGPDAHAMRLTFRNATASAFQGGRWAVVQRVADRRPIGVYDAIGDQATRPSHAALDGRAFELSDPFWNTWWPPNDHNCRCNVRTMTREQAARRGLKIETAADVYAQRLVVGGQELPLTPAPGWGVNPGLVSFGRGHTRRVLESMGQVVAEPVGARAVEARTALGMADNATEMVLRDPSGLPAIVTVEAALTVDVSAVQLGQVVATLQQPREVWVEFIRDTQGRGMFRRTYLGTEATAEVTRTAWTHVAAPVADAAELGLGKGAMRIYRSEP
jgi:SPP1 gp7 family putative phage head morphogenesis protein